MPTLRRRLAREPSVSREPERPGVPERPRARQGLPSGLSRSTSSILAIHCCHSCGPLSPARGGPGCRRRPPTLPSRSLALVWDRRGGQDMARSCDVVLHARRKPRRAAMVSGWRRKSRLCVPEDSASATPGSGPWGAPRPYGRFDGPALRLQGKRPYKGATNAHDRRLRTARNVS